MNLDALLALRSLGNGAYEVNVPDGWQQGRGCFGGLLLALVTRAMTHAVHDVTRPLRTMSAHLVAPALPGTARIDVELVRASNAVRAVRATLTQANAVVLSAVGIFAAAREGAPSWQHGVAMPEAPWSSFAVVPYVDGVMPVFARHFEFRMVSGVPFASEREAVTAAWVRSTLMSEIRDAAWVVLHGDVVWPAMYVTLDAPRPTATIAYTLDLHAPPPEDDLPLLHRGVSRFCAEGYASETRELYRPDGALVAVNHQVFVVIR